MKKEARVIAGDGFKLLEDPPSNVPNQGPIELQLLAIQRELSQFKYLYEKMNERMRNMDRQVKDLEHVDLLVKLLKSIDDHVSKHSCGCR